MRKLLESFLTAATVTTDTANQQLRPLSVVFAAAKVASKKLNPKLDLALRQSDDITGTALASAYTNTAALMEKFINLDAIMAFNRSLITAWQTAQTSQGRVAKMCSAEDLTPILIDLIPDEFSLNELSAIQDFLGKLSTCTTTLANETDTRNKYAEYICFITNIEGAIYHKIRNKAQAINVEACQLAVAQAANPDAKENAEKALRQEEARQKTVALLRQQDNLTRITAAQTAVQIAKQKADIRETAYWLEPKHQQELIYAQPMYTAMRHYQATLRTHIETKLKSINPALHQTVFCQADNSTCDPILRLAEISKSNTQSVAHEQIRKLTKSNLNLTRAIHNYKILADAEKTLHPDHASDEPGAQPRSLMQRIASLYQAYPTIDKSLQMTGDETVDRATTGIRQFFKKIWATITWHFSQAGGEQRALKQSVTAHRNKFFTQVPLMELNQAKQAAAKNAQPDDAVQPLLTGSIRRTV